MAIEKTGWQVHAYYLMRNHFHLVMEMKAERIIAVLQALVAMAIFKLANN